MEPKRIDVTVESQAEARAIYDLLVDGHSWPRWSRFESFELARPGDDGPSSVGAVRIFRMGRITSRERIVELIPGRRYSYAYLSGLPVRDYRADVDLEPSPSGTTIHWRSAFRPKIPGTGWLYRLILARFIRDTATRVAAEATAQSRHR
jgi:Polyketide cyclase / dehydrase and lipid transport